MRVDQIIIKSNLKDYTVNFEDNADFIKNLAQTPNSVFVIDENVWNAYKNSLLSAIPQEKVIVQPVCEDIKNIDTVCAIYEKIMQFAPRKNMTIISLGGGIIQDVTGFVASSLYRGVNWIFVPTTLLAQVDSCIGAKTSLNFKHFKNLVGTFYAPKEVYIYPEFLKSLNVQDFYSGVGEMAKLHIMAGKEKAQEFIEALPKIDALDNATLSKMTHNCLNIKKSYIETDEFDTGKRNMLNYGHCFGHAIESATDFAIPHGQAVVLGMILANKVSMDREILSKDKLKFLEDKILYPILKVSMPVLDESKVVQAMHQDKKNVGNSMALIMLNDNFETSKILDLQEDEVKKALAELGK